MAALMRQTYYPILLFAATGRLPTLLVASFLFRNMHVAPMIKWMSWFRLNQA